jgi:uncharacterized protein
MKELRQSSHLTGLFTNISDEDIKDADDKPPVAEIDDPNESLKADAPGEDEKD